MRKLPVVAIASSSALLVAAIVVSAPYLMAHWLYERLMKDRPETQNELEERLILTRRRAIPCEEITWSNLRRIPDPKTCFRYAVLGTAPIDVVVDAEGRVLRVVSTFE